MHIVFGEKVCFLQRQVQTLPELQRCLVCQSVVEEREKKMKQLLMKMLDAVPRCVLDQIRWERDMAMAQLEEIGVGFCEVTDDVVKVVRCKDCYWFDEKQLKKQGYFTCRASAMDADEDCYCSMAERKEDHEAYLKGANHERTVGDS